MGENVESKIEPWMREAAKAILHAGSWPDEWEPEDAAEIAAIIANQFSEHAPSSPAPRLEFQLDRISETEWSADTWLVLPNGKREVLGWMPCESQEEADKAVASLQKLYAEAVGPGSPAAPLVHEVKDSNGLREALTESFCKLDERYGEHWRSVVRKMLSPATPTPPTTTSFRCECGQNLLVEGKVIGKESQGIERKPGLRCQHCGRAYPGLHGPCPDCGEKTAQRLINYSLYENTSAAVAKTKNTPCSSSSPCGEIVAKGVCDRESRPHVKNFADAKRCVNWRPTIRVCQNCGREEPV